jgi:hypothetical protein
MVKVRRHHVASTWRWRSSETGLTYSYVTNRFWFTFGSLTFLDLDKLLFVDLKKNWGKTPAKPYHLLRFGRKLKRGQLNTVWQITEGVYSFPPPAAEIYALKFLPSEFETSIRYGLAELFEIIWNWFYIDPFLVKRNQVGKPGKIWWLLSELFWSWRLDKGIR